jgi:pimeloyl-ACP methyl ester carboxylesterase
MSGGTIFEPRGATEPAPDYLARVTAAGETVTTPCGDGAMTWHLFGEGPPLMLVHGGYGGWAHWIRNIPALAKRYRLLLPDLPGHGDSAMPPAPVSGHGLASVVAEGLDRLLPVGAPLDVAGFSFGGIVSGCLAERLGDRISNLVICGSNGLGLPRSRLTGFKHWRGVTDPDELADAHRTNLAILMFADPANVDDLAIHIQSVNTPKARIKSRLIAETDVLGAALPRVTARLSGIWGERDSYAAAYMDTRRDLFGRAQPGCAFRVIPGAGHWALYEDADAFNATLLDVLGAKSR